jgi:hypothetical protein
MVSARRICRQGHSDGISSACRRFGTNLDVPAGASNLARIQVQQRPARDLSLRLRKTLLKMTPIWGAHFKLSHYQTALNSSGLSPARQLWSGRSRELQERSFSANLTLKSGSQRRKRCSTAAPTLHAYAVFFAWDKVGFFWSKLKAARTSRSRNNRQLLISELDLAEWIVIGFAIAAPRPGLSSTPGKPAYRSRPSGMGRSAPPAKTLRKERHKHLRAHARAGRPNM